MWECCDCIGKRMERLEITTTHKQSVTRRYLLTWSTYGHLDVVASPRVSLQVVDHVQKVDSAAGIRRQRQAVPISHQSHSQRTRLPGRGHVQPPGVYLQRDREVTPCQAQTEPKGQGPERGRAAAARHAGFYSDKVSGSLRCRLANFPGVSPWRRHHGPGVCPPSRSSSSTHRHVLSAGMTPTTPASSSSTFTSCVSSIPLLLGRQAKYTRRRNFRSYAPSV